MSDSFDIETYLKWNLGIILCSLAISAAQDLWRGHRSGGLVFPPLSERGQIHVEGNYAYHLVYAHNNLAGQSTLTWTSDAQMVVNSTLMALVQLFYILRVSALCKYTAVTGALLLLVAASWALGIVLMVKSTLAHSVAVFSDMKDYAVATNALTAVTDIAITLTLVALLFTSRTGGSRSTRLIDRLIFYTINTGLMTSVLALLPIVMNVTKGDTMLYVLFSYVGSSLYTVSMVASLNARDDLRNHMAEAAGITTIPSMASLRGDGNLTVMEMKNSRKRALRLPPAVFIETSVETAH